MIFSYIFLRSVYAKKRIVDDATLLKVANQVTKIEAWAFKKIIEIWHSITKYFRIIVERRPKFCSKIS